MSYYTHSKRLELRSSLWFNFGLLRIFGYWPPEESSILFYKFYQFLILNMTYSLYMTSEIINVALSTSDLEKVTDASFLLLTHVAQLFKLYYFIKKRALILELLKLMKEDIFQPINEKQYKKLTGTLRLSAYYYYVFLSMAVATVSLWGAFPVLDKEQIEMHLPLSAWYPFRTDESPVFEIIYALQLVVVMINAATNISLDTTCTGFMAHVCGQLDILNDTLENIKEYSINLLVKNKRQELNTYVKKISSNQEMTDLEISNVKLEQNHEEVQNEMNKLLIRCVHHHLKIIDMANLIGEIFNISVLVQFVISAVIICITMFELTLVSVLSLQFFSMILYQGCMLMEVTLYCWYGNEIILKSNCLSASAYYSEWTDCSIKYKMQLLFIMVRSKIPIKIYAGNFFTLSLETFSAIIRSSWSYFAVLRQAHTK